MDLFRRACEVWVGPQASIARLTGLRCSFTVVKSLDSKPNTLDLKIWNLSQTTRGLVQGKGSDVYLLAGYEGELAQIFYGHARTVDHVQDHADIITRIQCGDGELAMEDHVNETRGPGADVAEVALKLVEKIPSVRAGNLRSALQKTKGSLGQFPHGYTASGPAHQELDRLLKSKGLTWSVQDGELQLLKETEPTPDEVILLAPDTGLIGSPAHASPDKKGGRPALKAKSLLRPAFLPGRAVQVQSKSLNGLYRTEKVTISGDTAGGDWYSELELKQIEATKVNAFLRRR